MVMSMSPVVRQMALMRPMLDNTMSVARVLGMAGHGMMGAALCMGVLVCRMPMGMLKGGMRRVVLAAPLWVQRVFEMGMTGSFVIVCCHKSEF